MHVYKYVRSRDYVLDSLINKHIIRLHNIYGFDDADEGQPKETEGWGNTFQIWDFKCDKCSFNENGKCKRNNCKSCHNLLMCHNKNNKTNNCNNLNKEGIADRNCITSIWLGEIYRDYIGCFSKSHNSKALIEKYCGRFGFILIYDELKDSKLYDIQYDGKMPNERISESIFEKAFNGESTQELKLRLLTHKLADFEYENEKRVVYEGKYNETSNYIEVKESDIGLKLIGVIPVNDKSNIGVEADKLKYYYKIILACKNNNINIYNRNSTEVDSKNKYGILTDANLYFYGKDDLLINIM